MWAYPGVFPLKLLFLHISLTIQVKPGLSSALSLLYFKFNTWHIIQNQQSDTSAFKALCYISAKDYYKDYNTLTS